MYGFLWNPVKLRQLYLLRSHISSRSFSFFSVVVVDRTVNDIFRQHHQNDRIRQNHAELTKSSKSSKSSKVCYIKLFIYLSLVFITDKFTQSAVTCWQKDPTIS